MAEEYLTLKLEPYFCEPCSNQKGTLVQELVRMIPQSFLVFDKLVGDEYYCCAVCFEKKFLVKGRKMVKSRKQVDDGQVEGHGSGADRGVGGGSPPAKVGSRSKVKLSLVKQTRK